MPGINVQPIIYALLIGIGIILGRILMAAQYSILRKEIDHPEAQEPAISIDEVRIRDLRRLF